MKRFEEFLREGIVYKTTSDVERARNLILQAERKMRSLLENLTKVGITKDNTNDYVEACYDILMFLVRAEMYSSGYVARGHGAHEAEVAFVRNIGVVESEVLFLDRIRYFRNGMLYYGTNVDKEYTEKVIVFTKKSYDKMKR